MTAEEIIKTLGLAPHPEGGFFRETWRAEGSGRAAGTAIYYLLRGQDRHRWHTVDSAEIWHFYAGAPLVLSIAETDAGPATDHNLGLDLHFKKRFGLSNQKQIFVVIYILDQPVKAIIMTLH